jgi:hypothetical protein
MVLRVVVPQRYALVVGDASFPVLFRNRNFLDLLDQGLVLKSHHKGRTDLVDAS